MPNQRLLTLDAAVERFYNVHIKEANKLKYNGKDNIIKYSLKKAWAPAFSGVARRKPEKFSKDHKDAINSYKTTLENELYQDIDSGKCNAGNWVSDFCTTHSNNMYEHIQEYKKEKKCSFSIETSYFGIVQKYVNITLKYLYCFYKKDVANYTKYKLDEKYDDEFFKKCHCPVDNFIRASIESNFIATKKEKSSHEDWLKTIANIGETTWSFMDKKEYKAFQAIVETICQKENIESKLFFDFLYW